MSTTTATKPADRKRRHSIDSALRSLGRKQDIKIEINPRTGNPVLTIQSKAAKKVNDLGNGSWGKIDFLRKRIQVIHGEF